jgi:hypothetical protein
METKLLLIETKNVIVLMTGSIVFILFFPDKSSLLLCQLESNKVDMMTAGNAVADLRTAAPQCINVRNLQVYKSRDWPF